MTPKFKRGDNVKFHCPWAGLGTGRIEAIDFYRHETWYTLRLDNGYCATVSENALEFTNIVLPAYLESLGCSEQKPKGLYDGNDWTSEWMDATVDLDLTPIPKGQPKDPKCECGAAAVGVNKHSNWCPMQCLEGE